MGFCPPTRPVPRDRLSESADPLELFASETAQVEPAADRFAPAVEEFTSASDQLAPAVEAFASAADRFAPWAEEFSPGADRFTPGAEEFSSAADRFTPGAEEFGSAADRFASGVQEFTSATEPFGPATQRHTRATGEFPPAAGRLVSATEWLAPPSAEPVAPRRPLIVPAHTGPLSLGDIVNRDVSIEWDEAVAVVEELCAEVTGDDRPVPDLYGIFITATGAVLLSGAGGERGPRAAGRTLHALLSSANTPVPLRLFVTQSTAPETYASVAEFAAALSYFGKPGRADLIRALHRRGAAAAARSSPAPVLETPKADPPPKSPRQHAPRRARSLRTATVLAALAGAALVAVAIRLAAPESPDRLAVPVLPALVAEVNSVVRSLGSQVGRGSATAGPPRAEDVAHRDQRPLDPPRRDQRPVEPSRRDQRPLEPPNRPEVGRPVDGSQSLDARVTVLPPAALNDQLVTTATTPEVVPPAPIARAASLPAGTAGASAIYSPADADVRPPVLLYPQLPQPLFTDARPASLNAMEVLVSELGTVEHVRLIAGPRRLPDVMLLSGAKTWRFSPAMKEETPVRYRAVLSWSGAP
jgi:hypothetical protein